MEDNTPRAEEDNYDSSSIKVLKGLDIAWFDLAMRLR